MLFLIQSANQTIFSILCRKWNDSSFQRAEWFKYSNPTPDVFISTIGAEDKQKRVAEVERKKCDKRFFPLFSPFLQLPRCLISSQGFS